VGLGERWLAGERALSDALPISQQERALRFIRSRPGCSTKEVAEALGIQRASSTIAYLRDTGRVRTERATRGKLRIWAA